MDGGQPGAKNASSLGASSVEPENIVSQPTGGVKGENAEEIPRAPRTIVERDAEVRERAFIRRARGLYAQALMDTRSGVDSEAAMH